MRSRWMITNFERMENNPFTESIDPLLKYLSAMCHSRLLPSRSQPAQIIIHITQIQQNIYSSSLNRLSLIRQYLRYKKPKCIVRATGILRKISGKQIYIFYPFSKGISILYLFSINSDYLSNNSVPETTPHAVQ